MKITPEIAEQINELYLIYKVKSKVAKEIGCSAATVSRYIIDGYQSKAIRQSFTFEGKVGNADWLINTLNKIDNAGQRLCEACMLSDEEWSDLKELQKEILINE